MALGFFLSPRWKMSSLIANKTSVEPSELRLRRQSLLRESLCTWDHFEKTYATCSCGRKSQVRTAVFLKTRTSMLKQVLELPCNHLEPVPPLFSDLSHLQGIFNRPTAAPWIFSLFLTIRDCAFFPIVMKLQQVVTSTCLNASSCCHVIQLISYSSTSNSTGAPTKVTRK